MSESVARDFPGTNDITRKIHGGRRYFSRREISALVGGPGDMAVNRHILEIPPTATGLPLKNEKPPTAGTLPPYCITAGQIPPHYVFTASAKNVPPTLDTAKRVRPTLDTAKRYRQNGIPPKRYRRRWISPKRYRRYWIPPKRYRVHWIPLKKYRRFFSCSFFVLCSFWFFGFLFDRTSFWTCGQRDAPAPAHTPAPTLTYTTFSVVQQNNEGFKGES